MRYFFQYAADKLRIEKIENGKEGCSLFIILLCRICNHEWSEEINYPFVMLDLQSGVIELRICNPQHPLIIHRN